MHLYNIALCLNFQVALEKGCIQKYKTKENDPVITLESTNTTLWSKTDDF